MTPLVLRSFMGVSSPVVRAQLVRRNGREITIVLDADSEARIVQIAFARHALVVQ